MRAWMIAALLIGAACKGTRDDTTADDTVDETDETDTVDTVETDDTDSWDTAWNDGTGAEETGFTQDSASGGDSAEECQFGEVEDCDGSCYPAYFIGDGTCDDGAGFRSNFDCVQYNFDGGDCLGVDTGFSLDTDDACVFEVEMAITSWAVETGWEIRDLGNNLLYQVFPGTYTNNNRTYKHRITLPAGSYVFVGVDSNGNGWGSNTRYTIRNPITGVELSSGSMTSGSRMNFPFDATCDAAPNDTQTPATCGDVNVKIETRAWGGEISWDIVDSAGAVKGQGSGYLSNRRYDRRVSLSNGYHLMRLFDSYGDGWAGGTYEITDLVNGAVLSRGSLLDGSRSVRPFVIDCGDTATYDIDDTDGLPDPTTSEVTCADIALALHLGAGGNEVGWELRTATGTLIDRRDPGLYGSDSDWYIDLNIPPGDYQLTLTDTGGNGMGGGSVEVIDVESGYRFVDDDGFTSGSTYRIDFTIECGGIITDTAPDTDSPTGPTGGCAPGAVEDCGGICWPQSFVGDGYCDDGTLYAPDFFCGEYAFDGGDCQVGN